MPTKLYRLRRRTDFVRVSTKGTKCAVLGLVLLVMKRGDGAAARLGFTVTRKIGNAVARNRTRRRLKEAARALLRERRVSGADLVLVGRAGTGERDFTALCEDLRRALIRTGVL